MRRHTMAADYLSSGTIAVAAAATGFALWRHGLPTSDLAIFMSLAVLGGAMQAYPLRPAERRVADPLWTVTVFAGVLLLPASWAVLLALAVWVPQLIPWSRPLGASLWTEPQEAAATDTLAAFAASWTLGGAALPDFVAWRDLTWVGTGIVVFVGVRLGLKAIHRATASGRGTAADLFHPLALGPELFFPVLGVTLALLWRLHPALLMLAILPSMLVYRAMRTVRLVPAADLDPKTGLFSFSYFDERLRVEVEQAQAKGRPLSLVFADLDFLREINNTYGHMAGDLAISRMAKVTSACSAHGGFAARFGGEEFVVVLPGTGADEAVHVARRMRELLSAETVSLTDGQAFTCTASFGVATYPNDGATAEQLIQAADRALYQSKRAGRNRVTMTGPEGSRRSRVEHPVSGSDGGEQAPEAPPAKCRTVPNWQAGLWILAACVAGAATVAWSLSHLEWVQHWRLILGFGMAAVTIQLMKVDVFVDDGTRRSLSLAIGVAIGAGALLGPSAAVIVNLMAGLVHALRAPKFNPVKVCFNLAIVALSAGAGTLPFLLQSGHEVEVFGPQGILMAALAGLISWAVNATLLSVVLAAVQQSSPLAIWRTGFAWITPYYLQTAMIGGLLGYYYPVLGWLGTGTALGILAILRQTFVRQVSQVAASLKAVQEARDLLTLAHKVEQESLRDMTEALSAIVDARDVSLYGHSQHVGMLATTIARHLGITDPAELESIRTAGLLHDLGKLGIPEQILHKPGKLTPEEYEVVKRHAGLGASILGEVRGLARLSPLVESHHEFWNGQGYPRGLAGPEIPLGARIIAVADALDCMLSDRPYSRARSLPAALAELDRCAGTQFDPRVVAAAHRAVENADPELKAHLHREKAAEDVQPEWVSAILTSSGAYQPTQR